MKRSGYRPCHGAKRLTDVDAPGGCDTPWYSQSGVRNTQEPAPQDVLAPHGCGGTRVQGDDSGRPSEESDRAATQPNDSVREKAHRTTARRVMNPPQPRSQAFSTKTSASCSDTTHCVNSAAPESAPLLAVRHLCAKPSAADSLQADRQSRAGRFGIATQRGE